MSGTSDHTERPDMYYDKQSKDRQDRYKAMLAIVGSLSRLFSTAEEPFLYYRAHENIFTKYFDCENNARSDDSADACTIEGIGIGLKTWVGQDNQKVAEFGRLRPDYKDLRGIELVKKIAEYRNLRIRTTMNAHGLHDMLYHIVKRIPGAMCIYESAFDPIDIDNIVLDEERGNDNSIYFKDGKHTYHFSLSKNTLYMIFDDMELLDQFNVNIIDDPYDYLSKALKDDLDNITGGIPADFLTVKTAPKNQLCLRLYSTKSDGTKFVADKSGLNQWNGCRSVWKLNKETNIREHVKDIPRDPNEVYIPYPAEDRARKDFFPPKDTPFELKLPDGKIISAKVCQQDSKAIMSNPNNELGKWLLRGVFELPEGTKVTYKMLKEFGVDCVVFTKESDLHYSVDFGRLDTYEQFYGLRDIDNIEESEG